MKSHLVEEFIIPVCTQVLTGKITQINGFSSYQTDEWDEICKYALAHGLLPLLMRYVNTIKIEDKKGWVVVCSWYYGVLCESQTTEQIGNKTEKLVKILQKNHLDVMLFKGICLAQYYPSPLLRISADIDFYLYGKQEEGLKALEKEGVECDDAWNYHAHAELDGVRLELHQSFIDVNRFETNRIVEKALLELAVKEGKTCRWQWMGEDVTNAYKMTPTMNAIFLMRQMTIHFVTETIVLRMLYDWALFLLHEGKNVDWDKVMTLYEQVGMTDFACRIQYFVTLKLRMPGTNSCPLAPLGGEKTDRLWVSILTKCEGCINHSSPLKAGFMRRYQMLRDKWKYEMAYPKDSFWKTYLYVTFMGANNIVK